MFRRQSPQAIPIMIVERAWTRPFKYYFRIGGATFGICMLANFVTATAEPKRLEFMMDNPEIFTVGVLAKSMSYAVVWPSFYISTFRDYKTTLFFVSPDTIDKIKNGKVKI